MVWWYSTPLLADSANTLRIKILDNIACYIYLFIYLCCIKVNKTGIYSPDQIKLYQFKKKLYGYWLIYWTVTSLRYSTATFFKHNFCVKSYVPRKPWRDPSNRGLNEHGIYIRHCQESNSQPVSSQVSNDLFRYSLDDSPASYLTQLPSMPSHSSKLQLNCLFDSHQDYITRLGSWILAEVINFP